MAAIHVEGLKELVAKIGALGAADLLEPSMRRAVMRVWRGMGKYPPAKPGSSYIRTGTLGRKWVSKVTNQGGKLTGVVGTNVTYAPLVQNAIWQASIHKALWTNTDQAVMDAERPKLLADFRRVVQGALAK